MPGSLPGLALVPACVGMAVAWTWVVATLFVGQELAMHDTSQSCMLGGAAAALAAFAMLDLAGTRGPELNRRLMRVLSCLVAGLIVVDICLPGNPSLPMPLIAGAWTLLGVFGAYAIRRSFHLLASLATRLGGRSILRVACACLAGAAVLGLMASNMPVQEAAVVMIASVPVALWLLPQGRLMLGRKRRSAGKCACEKGADAGSADGAGSKPVDTSTAGGEGGRPASADTASDVNAANEYARALQANTGSSNDKSLHAAPASNEEACARPADCGETPAKPAGVRPTNGEDTRLQSAATKRTRESGTSTGQHSSLHLKQLAPYAFTFIAMGFTCGFHTSVGRVLYIDYEHFNLVFFAMLAACILCACLAKRLSLVQRSVPAIALQIPLACACVAFVPLLFLPDRPDNVLWELIQNTLVFLSSWSLLVAIALITCTDATCSGKTDTCATPYCAVGVATFALGLFIGWLVGQNSFAEYGASGMAFRLGVTACIALLVSSLLAASTRMADQAGIETSPSKTCPAGSNALSASTGRVGVSKTAASVYQTSDYESTVSADAPGNSEPALTVNRIDPAKGNALTGQADREAGAYSVDQTGCKPGPHLTGQAGCEAGAHSVGQTGCEAGPHMPATLLSPSADVEAEPEAEAAVSASIAAHTQALPSMTRGKNTAPLPLETGDVPAEPDTSQSSRPCTCAIEAAVDSVALHFGLSEREHSLLMLLAEGLTAQQAADRLTVSRNTVKSHMAHIYVKCNVHTRAELNKLLEAAKRL